MRRRINYTGRKRVLREHALISIRQPEGEAQQFDVDLLLSTYEFPPEASVFLEASTSNNRQRFSFGSVGALKPPADRRLTEMVPGEIVHFDLKIVGSDGRLHGRAAGIPAQSDDEAERQGTRRGILQILSCDLGELVWEMQFLETSHPILKVNSRLNDAKEIARSDPNFLAQVYPAVVTEILTRILIVERYSWDEGIPDPEDRWRHDWLRFARTLPEVGPIPSAANDDAEAIAAWIEEARQGFARKMLAVTKLNRISEGSE